MENTTSAQPGEAIPAFFMTIGPPAAGKTTYVSWELVARGEVRPTHVLNPDGLLFVKDRYEWSPERVARAWKQVWEDFLRLLSTKRNLVLDATTARVADRERFVTHAKEAGYRVVALWFRVDTEVLEKRDAEREDKNKRVGPDVLARFLGELEEPTLEEGFDAIWVLDEEGDVVRRIPPPADSNPSA